MPRDRTDDLVFRDDERQRLSNHLTPWRKPTLDDTNNLNSKADSASYYMNIHNAMSLNIKYKI
ncbi:MAG: hypothetical protein J07HX5_00145 [halophilic archaeon J07HX5]|nr:MAG: hypothetical protein J07HX5_00145 [halophilic archaeon J07HX5]